MKKVFFTAFAALAFAFTMTACGSNESANDSNADTSKTIVTDSACKGDCNHDCANCPNKGTDKCCKAQANGDNACCDQKGDSTQCKHQCKEGQEGCKHQCKEGCKHQCKEGEKKECEHKCQK